MAVWGQIKKAGIACWRALEAVGAIGSCLWLYDVVRKGSEFMQGMSPGAIALTILCVFLLGGIIWDSVRVWKRHRKEKPIPNIKPPLSDPWGMPIWTVIQHIRNCMAYGAFRSNVFELAWDLTVAMRQGKIRVKACPSPGEEPTWIPDSWLATAQLFVQDSNKIGVVQFADNFTWDAPTFNREEIDKEFRPRLLSLLEATTYLLDKTTIGDRTRQVGEVKELLFEAAVHRDEEKRLPLWGKLGEDHPCVEIPVREFVRHGLKWDGFNEIEIGDFTNIRFRGLDLERLWPMKKA